MPKAWRDLNLDERLGLALEFLKLTKSRPDLSVGNLRKEFATAHDLKASTVRLIDDLLWFSGFTKTAYRGIPPRPYRELTPEGEARVRENSFTVFHLPTFPEWVRDTFLTRLPPPPPGAVLKFVHGDFTFWVESDWKHRVYVEGPDQKLLPWQSPLDPAHMSRYGVVIPSDTMLYSVKHRAMAFIDATGTAGKVRNLVGYRFVPMDSSAIAARAAAGRPLARDRHFIVDPQGRVKVWRISQPSPGRSRYCVDFSSVPGFPSVIDVAYAKKMLEEKVPKGNTSMVPAVWS